MENKQNLKFKIIKFIKKFYKLVNFKKILAFLRIYVIYYVKL